MICHLAIMLFVYSGMSDDGHANNVVAELFYSTKNAKYDSVTFKKGR